MSLITFTVGKLYRLTKESGVYFWQFSTDEVRGFCRKLEDGDVIFVCSGETLRFSGINYLRVLLGDGKVGWIVDQPKFWQQA